MITIDRASLASAASQCARIASDYPLGLEASDGVLMLRSANPQLWMTLSVPCEGDLPSCHVDPGKFASVVTAILADAVRLEIADGALKFSGGKGRRSLQLIYNELPIREFVATTTVTIQADALGDAIGFALPHAAPPDDLAKAVVAGVHLRADGKALKAYGTDGKTLAVVEAGVCDQEFGATISHKTAELIARMSGPVEIGVNERAIEFTWEGGRLVSSIVEGDYPIGIIDRALSLGWDRSASFEAPAFLNATRGVRMLGEHDASSKSERLLLTLNGSATLCAQSSSGTATEEFPADFTGEEFSIGVIAGQVERTMRGFGDAILEASFLGALDPIKLVPAGRSDRLALLYPVRM